MEPTKSLPSAAVLYSRELDFKTFRDSRRFICRRGHDDDLNVEKSLHSATGFCGSRDDKEISRVFKMGSESERKISQSIGILSEAFGLNKNGIRIRLPPRGSPLTSFIISARKRVKESGERFWKSHASNSKEPKDRALERRRNSRHPDHKQILSETSPILKMDLLSKFFMAAIPVLKILMCCGVGAYLAHPSVNILTDDARKLLNRLVFIAFTPALVFSKLAKTVTYENILAWWYMPVNIILGFICGAAMGMLVVKYTSVPPHLKNLTIACCAAGNTGNVPLVLIPAICQEEGSPFGSSEVCSQNAVAYISYGLWIGIVLMWTFIYKLLRPPDFEEKSSTAAPVICAGSPHSSDFGDFQSAVYCDNMEDFDPRNNASMSDQPTDLSALSCLPPTGNRMQVSSSMSPRSPPPAPPDITQDPKAYFFFIVDKYDLKTVFTPPTSAAALGLLVGGIPPLKYLFNGPFLVVVDSAEIIGEAMIPSMNMVLGASLVKGGGASELATASIVGIIIVRLVALPIFGLILVTIVNSLGMLPADPLFRFVLVLQLTMPTAINIGTLSQLFCVGEKEAALVLFYAYVSAAVFITFWVIIYLQYFV